MYTTTLFVLICFRIDTLKYKIRYFGGGLLPTFHLSVVGGAAGWEGRADAHVTCGFLTLKSVHKQDTEPQSAPEGN